MFGLLMRYIDLTYMCNHRSCPSFPNSYLRSSPDIGKSKVLTKRIQLGADDTVKANDAIWSTASRWHAPVQNVSSSSSRLSRVTRSLSLQSSTPIWIHAGRLNIKHSRVHSGYWYRGTCNAGPAQMTSHLKHIDGAIC